jgi:hypothetical protein
MSIQGDAWLSSEDSDEYWAQGIKCFVQVEATDSDEIRLGVRLNDEGTDVATVYISRAEADRLARFVAAAVVTPVRMPA